MVKITGKRTRIHGAGRTDAGVHARGQVAAFETDSNLSPLEFVNALNYHLPEDISVRDARQTEAGFDPRRDAKSKDYRYTILNRRTPSPLDRRQSCQVYQKLDVVKMDEASRQFVGKHDFCAFTNREGNMKQTIRNIFSSRVRKEGDFVLFDITGASFLPQQVRRMVGSLLRIGTYQMDSEAFRQLLEAPNPGEARYVAPAHGLCLIKVNYS